MVLTNEHILLREVREQPRAVRKTIDAEKDEADHVARLMRRRQIHFVGMGSSYYASLYASYVIAGLTQRTAQTHLASEFIHYPSSVGVGHIIVALSQSGESVETVKAVRFLKKKGNIIVGVTNEPTSTLARLSDRVLLTRAGKERASSTKTFASTLAILYYLVVALAAQSKEVSEKKRDFLIERLSRMSRSLDMKFGIWNNDSEAQSSKFTNCRAAAVLARGPNLPAALQGALLLKEVAKIPTEGMSSGEFAHGPVEILSRNITVIILGSKRTSELQSRLALRSKSLHARTLMITRSMPRNVDSICYGEIDEYLAVFPCAVILELLAYHAALKQHLNPDKFRFIQKVTTQE